MPFDSNKAFDAGENGVAYGEGKHLVTAGDASPVGQQAPTWSRYYRTNGEFWIKFDTGANDWVIVRKGVVNQSASPGYNFGRANASPGAFLERVGGVVSNRVGLPISINGILDSVIVDNEDSTSYTVVVFEHSGNLAGRTNINTLVVSGFTGGAVYGLNQAVTLGKQLGAEITAGSAKNIGVTCILKGS